MMTTETLAPANLKRRARIAGLLYLANAITAAAGIIAIPAQLIVAGDITATAQNILAGEFMFRVAIFCGILSQVVFLFLALSLYRLFENVSQQLSRTLLALVVTSVPIAFFIIFNQVFALLLLKESFMTVFDQQQQFALVAANLKMVEAGIVLIGVFWGLWLIPFGLLAYKSNFIPKILGILLIVGGITYLMDVTAYILLPQFQPATNLIVAITTSVAEIAMVLWLLIWGAKPKAQSAPQLAQGGMAVQNVSA